MLSLLIFLVTCLLSLVATIKLKDDPNNPSAHAGIVLHAISSATLGGCLVATTIATMRKD